MRQSKAKNLLTSLEVGRDLRVRESSSEALDHPPSHFVQEEVISSLFLPPPSIYMGSWVPHVGTIITLQYVWN